MPSRIQIRGAAWYVAVDRPDGTERSIGCSKVFGEVTEDKVALMREIYEAIVAAQTAKFERTRAKAKATDKAKPCEKCKLHAPILAILTNGSLAAIAGVPAVAPVPPPPVVPPAPVLPPPSQVVPEYLAYLKANRANQTYLGRKCCLNRMMRELGSASWDGWRRFWTWWETDPTGQDNSKEKYVDDAQAMRSWAMASGYAAPDFKPSVNRPSLSPSQRRQQEELTDDDEGGVPYSVDESKKIRGVLSDRTLPVWSRFGTLICMYAGFAPVDALDLLRNKGVIEWGKGKDGLVWYRNSRHKTAVRIFVPLAPLSPPRCGRTEPPRAESTSARRSRSS